MIFVVLMTDGLFTDNSLKIIGRYNHNDKSWTVIQFANEESVDQFVKDRAAKLFRKLQEATDYADDESFDSFLRASGVRI